MSHHERRSRSGRAAGPPGGGEKPGPWIRIGDFRETSYWISVENATTGTAVKSDEGLEVIELLESGLVLKMPARVCASGHLLRIQIAQRSTTPVPPGEEARLIAAIDATAKVMAIEDFDAEHRVVTAHFYQYEEFHWRRLLTEYAKRQVEIRDLLRSRKA